MAVTVYHNLDPDAVGRLARPGAASDYRPRARDLELAGVVRDTDDPAAAFDHVIHRDGENWTAYQSVIAFGDPRSRRSTQEGDVFVTQDGAAHLVLPLGFRELPGLELPFLPERPAQTLSQRHTENKET